MKKQSKVRLARNMVRLMKKRREWRLRAVDAVECLATWPTGKPGRDKVERQVATSINKLREWFRDPRSSQVINAVQRRFVRTFRQQ